MAKPSVAVAIPSIDVRGELLRRALASVEEQTRVPEQIVVVIDEHRQGPSATRNACLDQVETDYVAWLDDDDYLYPEHLRLTMETASEHAADLVYPWFARQDGYDPFRVDHQQVFRRPWDERLWEALMTENNFIPITTLIKVDMLRSVGGFPLPWSEDWPHPSNEDWGCWKRLLNAGATFAHCPHETWQWCPHGIDRRPKGRVTQ